jgi:DNA-binding MarR family transcriptional regulator
MTKRLDVATAPGHLIRRAQQIAVGIFAQRLAEADITPVQFAILNALQDTPDIDQVTLAKRVAFDPATSGSESKGWLRRQPHATDRRRKLLVVTQQGVEALANMQAAVADVQTQILAPLSAAEQLQFVDLLTRLVAGHEAQ